MKPTDVLDAWFGAPDTSRYGQASKQWFKKDAEFDAMLQRRFGDVIEQALAGGLDDWTASPLGTLALILLLDQFTRNCFRRTARSFAGDARAVSLAQALVASGGDRTLPTVHHRVFAYLPFEHDERMASQAESVRLFSALYASSRDETVKENLVYAHRHADVIARFGRFPHRNAVLGRETTPEEARWLQKNGGF